MLMVWDRLPAWPDENVVLTEPTALAEGDIGPTVAEVKTRG